MSEYKLHLGNCLDHLEFMPDNSVDSIVTDPPYGLSFMNKKWDYDVPSVEIWAECLRVMKPGGYLLSFAGTRTQHRMAVNIEDAGFEIRDMVSFLYDTNETAQALIESLTQEQLKLLDATFGRDGMLAWAYGSGFPKSMDVSKAIDKAAGAKREVVGEDPQAARRNKNTSKFSGCYGSIEDKPSCPLTAPATEEAKQWGGWGTALKPAWEPITVARKPFKGTVAANVLAHGTGALNIDGCRVDAGQGRPLRILDAKDTSNNTYAGRMDGGSLAGGSKAAGETTLGRWPANLILSYNEDEFELRAGVTAEQKKELLKFLYENT